MGRIFRYRDESPDPVQSTLQLHSTYRRPTRQCDYLRAEYAMRQLTGNSE